MHSASDQRLRVASFRPRAMVVHAICGGLPGLARTNGKGWAVGRLAKTFGNGGPATIEDVANLARVSVATVSRALRGLPNVAPSTRLRVEEAAASLNYRPDPHASRLAAGRTFTVGMAVPLLGRWYFSQVIAGAHEVLAEAGYDLLLVGVDTQAAARRFVTEWAVIQKRVDGLVLADLRLDDEEIGELQAVGATVATIGARYAPFSSVTIDNRAAAALAVQHLIDLGHRRIGLIGGAPTIPSPNSVPDERRAGYRLALATAGITHEPSLETASDFTVDGGAIGMRRLLASPSPPSAVFAMSDEIAMGAMQVVRQAGLRIPADMSIIGFDGHDLAGVASLTTIRQPVERSGSLAARFIIDAINEGTGAQHAVEDVELIVRGTTARFDPGHEISARRRR